MTSAIEIRSVLSTSWTEERIVVVRSTMMVSLMAAGTEACKEGSVRRMRSTVSITLAWGCLKIMRTTEGLPSANPPARKFSTESRTSATSESLMAAPLL